MKIKIGYLISYDYKMFLTSLKQVYEHVDGIYLAIDKNFKTWSGNEFVIEESFFEELKHYDYKNKIEFYFDEFYVPELSPIACDIRERNLLLKKMGKGWLIQLDCDEYLYDFKKVRKFLKRHWYLNVFPKFTPIVFQGELITLYKELSDGFLYVDNKERFSFITNCNTYEGVRTNHSISNHLMKAKVIHQSWARSEEQMLFKIKNWGHRDDFDTQNYFEFWKSLNSSNYKNFKNFHPMRSNLWNELHFMKASTIDEFIKNYGKKNDQVLVNVGFFKLVTAFLKRILGKLNFGINNKFLKL
ncbi:hypothetical protein [Flavobacterium sp. TSSA_36]|uniref:hypothetical protein n=1 Tax=Flavobacterium sp. TSSA_36 TaxID=3447669 RepID=UPI003F3BA832